LDNNYYIIATMKNEEKHKAIIIDCRLIPGKLPYPPIPFLTPREIPTKEENL
jgi:hypothetical protein